jgi:hypothetical protein
VSIAVKRSRVAFASGVSSTGGAAVGAAAAVRSLTRSATRWCSDGGVPTYMSRPRGSTTASARRSPNRSAPAARRTTSPTSQPNVTAW